MTNSIPDSWMTVRLDSVAELSLGKMLDQTKNKGQLRPYLRNINVRWGSIDVSDISEMKFENNELERFSVKEGDILICEGGEPGRSAIWDGPDGQMMYQKALHRVRPKSTLQGQYLLACLRWDSLNGNLSQYFTGSTIKHLPSQALGSYRLPLPPINEQRRIVAKLDALLARIRCAREELDAAPGLLEALRKAIIKTACDGTLTREWRQADEVDALPSSWRRQKVSEIFLIQNGRPFPSEEYADSGIRLLRPGNLHASGSVLWRTDNTVSMERKWADQFPDYILGTGELLMNLTAQSLKDDFLGRVCIKQDSEFALLNQRICRFKNITNEDQRPYFLLFFKSPQFRAYVDTLDTGTLIRHMHAKQILSYEVAVPPIDEQKEIVRRVSSLFSRANALSAEVKAARERLDVLEQAVLAKAFRGELVPQDPSDEPASVLLERIRAERAAGAGEQPARKRGRAKQE